MLFRSVRSDPTIVCVVEGLQLPYDDSNFNVSNYSKNADDWIIKMMSKNVSETTLVSTVKKNLANIVKVLKKDSRFCQKRVHLNKELFSSVAQKLKNPQWYLNVFLYVCILSRVGYFKHDSEDGIFTITKIEPTNESANVNDHEFLVGDRLVFKNDELKKTNCEVDDTKPTNEDHSQPTNEKDHTQPTDEDSKPNELNGECSGHPF